MPFPRLLFQLRASHVGPTLGVTLLALAGVSYQSQKIKNDAAQRTGPIVQMSELQKHNTKDDCWVSLYGHVYDLSEFLKKHPGGAARILKFAGRDGTRGFRMQHSERYLARFLQDDWYKGEIEQIKAEKKKVLTVKERVKRKIKEVNPASVMAKSALKLKTPAISNHPRTKHAVRNRKKPPLAELSTIGDFDSVANHVLPTTLRTLIESRTENTSSKENAEVLEKISFKSPSPVDAILKKILFRSQHASNDGLNTTILGEHSKLPFLVYSLGNLDLIHNNGHGLLHKVADKHGVMALGDEKSDAFRHLSFKSRKGFEKTLKEISSVKSPTKALFVNVSGPHSKRFTLTWDDLLRLKGATDVPIVLKGLHAKDDVVHAAKLGFSGAVISGSRNESKSAIENLYKAKKAMQIAKIQNFELFVGGGFEQGADIVKALCLGATPAVSRSFAYSELYGEKGVDHAFSLLQKDITRVTQSLGAASVSELNEDLIDCRSLESKEPKCS